MGIGAGILIALLYFPLLLLSVMGIAACVYRFFTYRIGPEQAFFAYVCMLYPSLLLVLIAIQVFSLQIILASIGIGYLLQIVSWITMILPMKEL